MVKLDLTGSPAKSNIFQPDHFLLPLTHSCKCQRKAGRATSPKVPGKGEITHLSCCLHLEWFKDALNMQPPLSAGAPRVIWLNVADVRKEA